VPSTSGPLIRRRPRTPGHVVRAVGGNSALRRVITAYLAFSGALYGTWVAILVYAYETTGPASVGVVALVQLLPAGALAPIAAALADRFPRERVLLGGYVLQAAAYALTGAGMLLGAPPALVYASGALLAFATTITRPAQGALLPALARTPEELTAANSAAGTAEGFGVLLGPLAAAGLLAVASPGAVWLGGAGAALAAAALVTRLPRAVARRADGPAADAVEIAESAWSLLVGGLRATAGSPPTRLLVSILGVRMLSSGAIDVLFVLLALEVFDTGGGGAGVLTGALGLGLVMGGAASILLVGRQRMAPALAASALLWGIPLVLAATFAPAAAAPMLFAVAGIGFAAIDVGGRTLLQRVAPDRQLARVLGALEGIGLVFLALGSLVAPILASWFGPAGAMAVVGLLLPVTVLATWLPLRNLDRRGNVPVRAMALLARTTVFAPLAPPQLEAAARSARWVTAVTGEVLIRQGDAGDRYLVLESGLLRVTMDGVLVRTTSEPGDGMGEIALLRPVPRTATVEAGAPSVLLALGRADFLRVVTGNEQAQERATAIADDRLRHGVGQDDST
jgi:MFS family permease